MIVFCYGKRSPMTLHKLIKTKIFAAVNSTSIKFIAVVIFNYSIV